MLTNADCTIFQKCDSGYTPRVIKKCFWSEETKLDEAKDGLSSVDTLTVRIPLSECDGLKVKKGDLIARGHISGTVRSKSELEALCGNAYTVVGFKLNDIGSAQSRHWRINGR